MHQELRFHAQLLRTKPHLLHEELRRLPDLLIRHQHAQRSPPKSGINKLFRPTHLLEQLQSRIPRRFFHPIQGPECVDEHRVLRLDPRAANSSDVGSENVGIEHERSIAGSDELGDAVAGDPNGKQGSNVGSDGAVEAAGEEPVAAEDEEKVIGGVDEGADEMEDGLEMVVKGAGEDGRVRDDEVGEEVGRDGGGIGEKEAELGGENKGDIKAKEGGALGEENGDVGVGEVVGFQESEKGFRWRRWCGGGVVEEGKVWVMEMIGDRDESFEEGGSHWVEGCVGWRSSYLDAFIIFNTQFISAFL